MKSTLICTILLSFTCLLTACGENNAAKKIGIIVPIEHEAMTEIVAGFTETLKANYPGPIQFKIANAQGDLNLQRAIISQMKDENMDLIVPIATGPTEMTVASITNTPIVSLASIMTDKERKQRKVCNNVTVHDEIPVDKQIDFLHQIYPQITKLILIHSPDDKIFQEVTDAVKSAKKDNITIKPVMINSLSELYSVSKAIPSDSQGIFVLKDSLIVSGISTLTTLAKLRAIPLVTSDQGSVQNGATIALGVPEREIGSKGAYLALNVLEGKNPCQLAMVNMKDFTVFINKQSYENAKALTLIKKVAKEHHYVVRMI